MPRQSPAKGRGRKIAKDDAKSAKTNAAQEDVVDFTEDSPAPVSASSAVTPQKSKRKRDLDDYFVSTPATKASAAVVTPPEAKRAKQQDGKKKQEEKAYVPTYIHEHLEYLREGTAQLSECTRKVFELVKTNFYIPVDFENNRSFGPLSGSCFEERVISAYSCNLLKPKEGGNLTICTCCASDGHLRDDCPTLI